MTPFAKKKDIKNKWYIVDASNIVVGRLAYISKVLRGKNKSQNLIPIKIMVIL